MKNKLKRAISALLASVMVISSMNSVTFADEPSVTPNGDVTAVAAGDEIVSGDALKTEGTDDVQLYSLLPLEKIDVDLDLTDMLPLELENMKVKDLLNRLTYSDGAQAGEPVDIDENATTVWSYYYQDGGMYDEAWAKADINDTINLKYYVTNYGKKHDNIDGFDYFQIIVGSGNQLDPNNIRYDVTLEYPKIDTGYKFLSYIQKSSNNSTIREEIANNIHYYTNSLYDENGNYIYDDNGIKVIGKYELNISSKYKDIEELYITLDTESEDIVDVWQTRGYDIAAYKGLYDTAEEAKRAAASDSSIDITDKLINADMNKTDAGYKVGYYKNNYVTFVYSKDGNVICCENINLFVEAMSSYLYYSYPYTIDSSGMILLFDDIYADSEYDEEDLDGDGIEETDVYKYLLYKGYSSNAEYYYRIEYKYDGAVRNDMVDKAVVGFYESIEAAASQTDIKEQLFADDDADGYKANFMNGVTFTVFADGNVYHWKTIIQNSNIEDSPSDNTYFKINGFYNLDESEQDGYRQLESHKLPDDEDKYSKEYNYYTYFIFDDDADMTALVPYVYTSDKNSKIYCEGDQEELDKNSHENYISARDFTKIPSDLDSNPRNSHKFTVTSESEQRNENYFITVVKKVDGPKLFVNGPDKREVVLDSYSGKYHDILIANLGTEELTNLSVKLDAENIKLDDYWTIGGAGNNSLAAFTSFLLSWKKENIAKIRLIPDGDGIINGKLTISADGQEDRVIKLQGFAGDPKIDTTSLKDGVKYVPYQSIVTTNNKYTDNEVTFELVGGKLPDGIELKPDGEIYGTPTETGTFSFSVRANYSYDQFKPSTANLTINILDNTDENVDGQTDVADGFAITDRVEDIDIFEGDSDTDQIFEFEYDYAEHADEFQDLWLDGQKLTLGVDYTVDAGSTKATIRGQTFSKNGDGKHTIAAEYRNKSNQVKKAAQNYSRTTKPKTTKPSSSGGSSGGGGGGGSVVNKTVSYTVSYESNGGSAVKSQSVVKGQKVTFLATPEKPGYKFVGWYTDADLTKKFDQSEAITSSIKLYAKYEQVECTVWFDSNGGTEIASVNILGDTALESLPEPTKDKYSFVGWFTDDEKQFNAGDKIYANTTLYAKWELFIPEEAPEEASGFYDVEPNAWYYEDVNWAYHSNLMVGYNNAIFAPKNTTVLSNIVTVLAKLSGDDLAQYNNAPSVGSIAEGMWYTPYAKWAEDKGIINAETFSPNEEISREDMAVMLDNYINYVGMAVEANDTVTQFADDELISDDTRASIQKLYNIGIIAGKGNNVIDPKGLTTRAEFASLIHRISLLK